MVIPVAVLAAGADGLVTELEDAPPAAEVLGALFADELHPVRIRAVTAAVAAAAGAIVFMTTTTGPLVE